MDLEPYTLEVSGTYKSITDLQWQDIPSFAVLTGTNGAGKSQLLDLLGHKLAGALPRNFQDPEWNAVKVEVKQAQFPREDVAYIASERQMENAVAFELS